MNNWEIVAKAITEPGLKITWKEVDCLFYVYYKDGDWWDQKDELYNEYYVTQTLVTGKYTWEIYQ